MDSAAVRSKAVVLPLFIHCLLLLLLSVAVQVLQSSRLGRERRLFYVLRGLHVMSLFLFFESSSRCHGLVCSL